MGKQQRDQRAHWREAVARRDGGRCVICGEPAEEIHHILERKLWPCGGYVLDNGATLCPRHHLAAEQTRLACNLIRAAAGIRAIALPPGLPPTSCYDKWGNAILPNGRRVAGPLAQDDGCRRALAAGGVVLALSEAVI